MQQKHVLLQLLKNKAFMQFYKTDIFSGVFRWWRTPRHGRPSFRLRRRWRRSSRRRFPVILIPVRLVVLLIYPTVPLLTHIGKSVRLPACSAATAPSSCPCKLCYIYISSSPPPALLPPHGGSARAAYCRATSCAPNGDDAKFLLFTLVTTSLPTVFCCDSYWTISKFQLKQINRFSLIHIGPKLFSNQDLSTCCNQVN